MGSHLPRARGACQAAVTPPERVRRESSEGGEAMHAMAAPPLTMRRHVDLGRVASAVCR
ncbi:putative leader peptide [Streptomyces flaveolus]